MLTSSLCGDSTVKKFHVSLILKCNMNQGCTHQPPKHKPPLHPYLNHRKPFTIELLFLIQHSWAWICLHSHVIKLLESLNENTADLAEFTSTRQWRHGNCSKFTQSLHGHGARGTQCKSAEHCCNALQASIQKLNTHFFIILLLAHLLNFCKSGLCL